MTNCTCRRHAWNPSCVAHPRASEMSELVTMSFDPDWRVAPGETIKWMMEEHGIDSYDVANRMRVSRGLVMRLLTGDLPIDDGVAYKLERAFGVSATFWRNLDRQYRRPLTKGKQ